MMTENTHLHSKNNELMLYKEIVDKVKDVILLLDIDGKIIYANHEAVKLYGYSLDELLSMHIADLRSENKLDLVKKQFETAIKQSIEFDTIHFKKDGSGIPVGAKAMAIEVGKEKFVLSIIRDITERVTKEKQLKEKNKELTVFNEELRANYTQLEIISREAEKANQAKSQFLANMSHELRTPLNGIIGVTELIGYTKLSSEQTEYIQILKSSSEHLLSIINDLLGIAKIESGKVELNNAKFNVRSNMEIIIRQLSLPAKNKGIEIMYSIDPLISDEYIGDKVRFNQVLINLTNNAIKFTEKGYICIRLKKLSESETSVTLEISVEDTGIGIPVSYQDDVFKMFTQADNSSTRKFGGTGLGLAIAKDLVQLMGGEIRFESEEGKGSIFYFTVTFDKLPADIAKYNQNQYPAVDCKQSKRILVGEDNDTNKKIISAYLKNLNYQYKVVGNGQDVIDELKTNAYDLILMDIQMPILSGMEATQIIRNNEEETRRHIPIIAMTAHAMDGDKEDLIARGMDDYISKPFELRTLTDLLSKYLK